jgi:hypothetical protein
MRTGLSAWCFDDAFLSQLRDFTTDPVHFPSADMEAFIKDLHNSGQRYGKGQGTRDSTVGSGGETECQ